MPDYKLGRRPPSGKPAILLGDHLRAIPTAPIADAAPNLDFGMDLNDQVGICVVAGARDHALQVINTALLGSYTPMTVDELVRDYQTQNPGFVLGDPNHGAGSADDQGMDIQTYLAYLVRQGVILGFAKVDHTNPAEMDAAVWLGLAIVTGETLTQQQMQTNQPWTIVPGEQPVGGHCTVTVGYPDGSTDTAVTWGTTVEMDEGFVGHAVEEAWFVVTQAHVDHPRFRGYIDWPSWCAAYTSLTGRPCPVVGPSPIPPLPAPPPSPPPTPIPPVDPDQQLVAASDAWLAIHHRGPNRRFADAVRAWRAAKGY